MNAVQYVFIIFVVFVSILIGGYFFFTDNQKTEPLVVGDINGEADKETVESIDEVSLPENAGREEDLRLDTRVDTKQPETSSETSAADSTQTDSVADTKQMADGEVPWELVRGIRAWQWNWQDVVDLKLRIDTQEDYEKFWSTRTTVYDEVLPEINFSDHTLLGKYTSLPCNPYYDNRKVLRDDFNKVYRYMVDIWAGPVFECLGTDASFLFITIPKMPSDYDVIFEVNRITQPIIELFKKIKEKQ